METLFICLANSKKYNERCIAGIELKASSRKGHKFDIVRTANDRPKWIRPISESEHGEVPANLVDHVNLLDVAKINIVKSTPQGYQSENVFFDDKPLEYIESIDLVPDSIDKLVDNDKYLFGNEESSVSSKNIDEIQYSLVLVKPAEHKVYQREKSSGGMQNRVKFLYNDIEYDLPLTDIDFNNKFNDNSELLTDCEHVYFTISLGTEFNSRYYKLIAGVIYK